MTYKQLIEELEKLRDEGKNIDNCEVLFITRKGYERSIDCVEISADINSLRFIKLESK